MSVVVDILHDLARAIEGQPVPRVQRLQMPAAALRPHKDGEFAALVLDDGSIGLVYLLLDGTLAGLEGPRGALPVAGQDALSLAARWQDPDPAWRALGAAAANALTHHLFRRAGFEPPPATDSVGGLCPGPGEAVGMVGLFPPLVPRLRAHGAQLTVLERRADLAGPRDGWAVTLDPADLAGCSQVLVTSTVLLNDSFDAVIGGLPQARVIALVGPGAGCLPDALFRRGVTQVGGSWVTDAPALLAALADGAAWGRHARKSALTPSTYPGWPALVAAAR